MEEALSDGVRPHSSPLVGNIGVTFHRPWTLHMPHNWGGDKSQAPRHYFAREHQGASDIAEENGGGGGCAKHPLILATGVTTLMDLVAANLALQAQSERSEASDVSDAGMACAERGHLGREFGQQGAECLSFGQGVWKVWRQA